MAFQITYKDKDVLIEKEPIRKTPAEPIYPDLLEILIDIPDDVEIIGDIDENDRLANEKAGYSFVFSFDDLIEKGVDLAKIFFSGDDYNNRETRFDATSAEYETKAMNLGLPPNHSDPYPVDEKIQELQSHAPTAKMHEMNLTDASSNDVEITKALMNLSDITEKRLAQLENVVATLMRNTFRMGARMHINCVYYGGQSSYRKYNTIRCLHHDRIEDGQLMSLDQCLACTRYEPIIGQVYDIVNETGLSEKIIADNNQMSYRTMDDYLAFSQSERLPEPEEKALIDIKALAERHKDDTDFSELWPEGYAMDWSLVPVEEQSYHVVYEDGSQSKTLDSSYHPFASENAYSNGSQISSSSTGSGYYTALEGSMLTASQILANDRAFDQVTDSKLKEYINNGKQYARDNVDTALNNMNKAGYEDDLMKIATKHGLDPLWMMAIIVVESTGRVSHSNDATTSYRGLMQVDYRNLPSGWMTMPEKQKAIENIEVGCKMYNQKLKAIWGTTNHVLGSIGYNAGEGMALGVSSRSVPPIHEPGLSKDKHDTFTWVEVANNLARNVRTFYGEKAVFEKLTYYPRMHFVYKELQKKKNVNPLVGAHGLQFPYGIDTVKSKAIYFTSEFGMRFHTGRNEYRMHNGIDMHTGRGTPICAAQAGEVIVVGWQAGGAGRYVTIDHGNDIYTLYMHMEQGSPAAAGISVGTRVQAGQVIGTEGNTGLNMGSTGIHLHFEVRIGGNQSKHAVNPAEEIFPFMRGMKKNSSKPMAFDI